MFIVPLMVPLEEEASVGSPRTLNLQAADLAPQQSFVYLFRSGQLKTP
jgi:hypothetical protein